MVRGENNVDGFDDGREPMEWDKTDQIVDGCRPSVYLQVDNARKGRDPTAILRVNGCNTQRWVTD